MLALFKKDVEKKLNAATIGKEWKVFTEIHDIEGNNSCDQPSTHFQGDKFIFEQFYN